MNPTGIHRLSESDYHGDKIAPKPSLSSSLAKVILAQSPRHAWTQSRRLNPNFHEKISATFDLGKTVHRMVLGRGAEYEEIPGEMLAANGAASTKEAKAFIAECRERGVVPLKSDDIDLARTISASVVESLKDFGITIEPGRTEIAAIAEIDGAWCRAMADYAPVDPRQPLYDLKTCEDASPEAIESAVRNYGYDVQAAHYQAVWQAATGEARPFRFIFIEKSPPFEVAVVTLKAEAGHSADWMAQARDRIASARTVWRECVESNVWPGYPRRILELGAPHWINTRWADSPAWTDGTSSDLKRVSKATLARIAEWQSPKGLTS